MKHFRNKFRQQASQRGFSLMEVLIGIAIFSIGMLALGSLQGALTRSTAEAKVRSAAVNIAEHIIEEQRGFTLVSGLGFTFENIATRTTPTIFNGEMTRDPTGDPIGVTYSVTQDVTDYYYDLASDAFTTCPTCVGISDYKTVVVTVAWNDNREFVIDENTAAADLGGGSVQVSASISKVSVAAALSVTAEDDGDIIAPPIAYEPGAKPDIVALDLDGGKFKESLTPEPKVTRTDELVETRFDVITYSQNDAGSEFLRREEFAAVSCECTLKAAPGSADDGGRRPALWLGDEYLEPELVDKPYGISANTQQSSLCDACCQDHHDGGTGSKDLAYGDGGAILYNPYRASDDYATGTFAGDHKHYTKDRRGNFSVAAVDDTYVEACRLVRKDGFFRVAQDFSIQDLNVFPYDYLVGTTDVTAYSSWLTGEVSTFTNTLVASPDGYGVSVPFIAPIFARATRTPHASTVVASGDLTLDWTELPTALNADFQQLRSRGVYIDYMIKDLRYAIACINGGSSAETCKYGDVILDKVTGTNVLEIIPFFEVQMTFLNSWEEELGKITVEVTSEPLETGNAHTRGVASEAVNGTSFEVVTATGSDGVLGFTDTDPIEPNDPLDPSYNNFSNTIEVHLDNSGATTHTGKIVTGTITSGVSGVQARSVVITGTNAICNYVGVTFTCLVPAGGGAVLTLANYHKTNDKNIVACSSDTVTLPSAQGSDTASNPWTNFVLDDALDSTTVTYQISIEPINCDDFVPL